MQLHSEGQQDYIEELQKLKALELKRIDDSSHPADHKNTLIKGVVDKFKKLIKQSDQSLFLNAGR